MAALKEIKSLLGSNETTLNRSWVKSTCQWWISHCENAGLCSCPLAWREDVTSVPKQIPAVRCLISALSYSCPLQDGIGCCAETTSLLLWQTTGFSVCLCLLCQCPNGHQYKGTSVAVLMVSTSSPRASHFHNLSLNAALGQQGKSQCGRFTAVLKPRHP